jgi:glucose dehydrogenase
MMDGFFPVVPHWRGCMIDSDGYMGASAQTTDQLVKGATDTSNVLNYGMGYNLQRFGPLTQISKGNAKNLAPELRFRR